MLTMYLFFPFFRVGGGAEVSVDWAKRKIVSTTSLCMRSSEELGVFGSPPTKKTLRVNKKL